MTDLDPNAAQIDYWNGEVGRRWAEMQSHIDGLFSEITALLIEAAGPVPGERVVDIGCGCGATLIELARRVDPSGHVTGLDISEVMLDVARRRIAAAGLSQAEVCLADAATHPFDPVADLVLSRFGVMFFDAPAAAFARIRTALKPGGRLVFVCWRALAENGWVTLPMAAAKPYLDGVEEPPADPHAPGPFAFADADRLRAILREAGFSAIDIAPRDPMLRLAGAGEAATAAALITQIGPVSRALKQEGEAVRPQVEAAVAAALAPYDRADGIFLPAAVWLVGARA